MPWNLVVKLDTMIIAVPVPLSSPMAMSSFMIIAIRGCDVHFDGNNIHFWEWCKSSRSELMIFHQKLIVLFSYQEHRYQLVVFSVTSLSMLLLQEHIGSMKNVESLFLHIFLSNGFPKEFHLRANSEYHRIVLNH
ncbi:hypothetical protein ACFX11_034253 [Malus domestica]